MCDPCSEGDHRPGVVVIGCGNPDRRDDGAGLAVARQVADLGVEVRYCTSDLLELLDLWAGFDHAIVVDAALPRGECRASRPLSHSLDLNQVVELARSVGRLPREITIITVEGRDFGFGVGLSDPVRGQLADCCRRVLCAVERSG